MTGTSTTNTEPGVIAHALHALADHIAKHQLPAPAEFQISGDADEQPRRLELHLSGCDAIAWSTSIAIDDYSREAAGRGSLVEWHLVQGRLPDTGVRVQLQWCWMANTSKRVSA